MGGMTFTVWLSEQRHRQDPIGELARFAAPYHPAWPTIAHKVDTYRRALHRRGDDAALDVAIDQAWAEYESKSREAA